MTKRCSWLGTDALLVAYHDEEWGVPEFDSRALWESLMLSGFQAGLSWLTILHKRAAFRRAFHGFKPESVAHYGASDVDRLLADPTIIRSRRKIEATIAGAQIYLGMREQALKTRGFQFVGPVIVYAWMQSIGMVNDHSASCFRRRAVRQYSHPSQTKGTT
jgi:DNA-3-methyladenine glycosylase I